MLFFLFLCLTTIQLAFTQSDPPAPVITDNTPGSGYTVTINAGPGSITGGFYFITTTDQRGVQVSASLNGFNVTDENTYTYHIHQYPVPADGNCNSTGEHLDPYHAGATYQCDPTNQSLCQIGDLSGKHGALHFNGTAGTGSFSFTYFDDFLSTTMSNPAFFGNLSVVIHRERDGFRLNCGNMVPLGSYAAANASEIAGNFSTSNTSTTYNSPMTSVLTSVVATATIIPTDLTSYPTSTTTTIASQTTSPIQVTVSTSSTIGPTLTGIQQGNGASIVSIGRNMLIFTGLLVLATTCT